MPTSRSELEPSRCDVAAIERRSSDGLASDAAESVRVTAPPSSGALSSAGCSSQPRSARALVRSPPARAVRRGVLLLALFCVALPARVAHLDATGFAEDEVDKLRAIAAYARGDFTADPEHPMLMKLAMLASHQTTGVWNRAAAAFGGPLLSEEAAIRLPNAVAGALIAVILFLLVELLFDRWTAVGAALLWAFDVNAIAVNRIGKEDTLLLLFLLLAAWYYEVGKRVGRTDPVAAQRWFTRCGAAFGLMTAAKYMPYMYGVHVIFFRAADPHPGLNRPDKRPFYLAMLTAFLIANAAILLPANWQALAMYARESTLTHTGYVFAGRVWMNKFSATPWGVPPWFYLTYLVTKVPLPVLMAFGSGLAQLVVRRSERGYVFARVFLVFLVVPYSLVASKFVRYMLPMFAMVDLVAAVGLVWGLRRCAGLARALAVPCVAGVSLGVLGSGALAAMAASPHFSLFQNQVGALLTRNELLFPHDELYDAGMREAVAYVAVAAPRSATVLSEAPAVVRTYLDRFGRADVVAAALSSGRPPDAGGEIWTLVQDGRRYFENEALVAAVRLRPPIHEIFVDGVRAVEIFKGR